MVALISLGDSGLKEDKSVKLADIVMPEREIDTFMDDVDNLRNLRSNQKILHSLNWISSLLKVLMSAFQNPKLSLQLVEVSLETVNTYHFLRFSLNILEELKSEELWVLQS